MTQCRDTDRTQRDAGRFAAVRALVAVEATDVVCFLWFETIGWTAGAAAASSDLGAGVGAMAGGAMTGAIAGGAVSALGRDAMLSLVAATARAIATSVSRAVPGGAFGFASTATVFGRGAGAPLDAAF